MKEGNYMEIRRSEYNLYWSQQAITDKKNKQKKQDIDDQLASPARSSKRIKLQKSIIVKEKDEVLEQSLHSISSTIKTGALSVYTGQKYKQLDNEQKNVVSNGLNSIIDLSNEIKQGQRSLFTKEEWKQVQAKHNKDKLIWTVFDDQLKKELKKIEKLAAEDQKAAYKESLKMQGVYALTEKERYFACYSHILKVIIKTPGILAGDNDITKEYTEEDYVVKIWSPLLESFFGYSRLWI